MKRLLNLFAVIAVALSLGGCLTLDSGGVSVFKGGNSVTAPIVNPAQPVNIFQVKSVHKTALGLANEYRGYCFPTSPFIPYKTIMEDPVKGAICKYRYRNVERLQGADNKAALAIEKADDFIARNPKLSAVTVVREAWAAVVNFQGTINTVAASAAPVQQ